MVPTSRSCLYPHSRSGRTVSHWSAAKTSNPMTLPQYAKSFATPCPPASVDLAIDPRASPRPPTRLPVSPKHTKQKDRRRFKKMDRTNCPFCCPDTSCQQSLPPIPGAIAAVNRSPMPRSCRINRANSPCCKHPPHVGGPFLWIPLSPTALAGDPFVLDLGLPWGW
ncbi:MAG: hypothetical protein BWY17_03093 [Deltaproteobacteria bacterium ADurb.Bin207]|nr:MAG: hypothetical protein BWY17_03093 [Deltaproteobacteria bacterium ADurb.Bin207]